MKSLILLTLILFSSLLNAQPKDANVINVKGVTFKEVAINLLDFGYSFEKIDSNFQTIKTEYKEIKGYSPTIMLEVRVKDSVAIIKGKTINFNILFDAENVKWKGVQKLAFKEMNDFALSFKKPVEYFIK